MTVYGTPLRIGETPEAKKEMMRGQGFSGSQVDFYQAREVPAPMMTIVQAVQPAKGEIVTRPTIPSSYPG